MFPLGIAHAPTPAQRHYAGGIPQHRPHRGILRRRQARIVYERNRSQATSGYQEDGVGPRTCLGGAAPRSLVGQRKL